MKNINKWTETKYMFKNGKLRGTRNKKFLAVGSRLMADLVATCYETSLKKFAHGDLLDLGCGYVPLYGAYKNYIDSVICVDWEESLHNNEFLDLVCDLNSPLPFTSKSFDTVVLSDVLEHLVHPRKLLLEVFRIMKDDAVLLINTPFFYRIHEAPYDYYRYTQYAYKNFAKSAGFSINEIYPIGGVVECISDVLCKTVAKIPFFGTVFSECIRILCVVFRKTRVGVKIYRKTSPFFPLGYFVVMKKVDSNYYCRCL